MCQSAVSRNIEEYFKKFLDLHLDGDDFQNVIISIMCTLEAGTLVGGSKIDISLEFRTHLLNGLLLFVFGGTGTYFILQLQDGSLLWTMSINGVKYPFALNDDLMYIGKVFMKRADQEF